VNPRVSVVIPTYNRKAVLLESIASVRQQTFGDLEILVCDDGSSDGSREAV
jgi:glycosyltransferase involved in cell wall biosynthesis